MIIVPFDLLISILGMVTKRVSMDAPFSLEKGASGFLVITVDQDSKFPTGLIRAVLTVSGDDYNAKQRVILNPESGSRCEIAIDTKHCGIIVNEIKRISITSLVGLFSVAVKIRCKATVLVLPTPLRPPHIVALPRGIILHPKRGGGFSEDHELRQYSIGDPVRTIHWKLTAKHDSLIVREPLLPPQHSRLVEVAQWKGPYERDLILGRLRWISDYLLQWDLPYCIRIGGDGLVAEITNAADFLKYLYSVLDKESASMPVPVSLPVRFSWVFRIDAKEDDTK